ncbi:MAG: hypothetical protein AAF799_22375 [Myxococcota bacterium]
MFDQASVVGITTGLDAALDRGEPFCLEVDLTQSTRLDWKELKAFGAYARASKERHNALLFTVALVILSAMVRGAIKVLFQIHSPGYAHRVLQHRSEALEYMEPYLAQLRQGMAANG